MKIRNLILYISLILYTPLALFSASDEEILKSMRDELNRSMKELKIENLAKPYYLEYTIVLNDPVVIRGQLGDLAENNSNRSAYLNVGIRFGDYKFDNTNFFDIGLSFFGSGDDEERYKRRNLPIDLNYDILRRELWLATDAAYKQAAEIYSKKEATIKNRMRKDTTPDFLMVPPQKNYLAAQNPALNKAELEAIAREVSAVFKKYPSIYTSGVTFEYLPKKFFYVNSEGMEYTKTEYFSNLEAVAYTQAEDGMPLANFYIAQSQLPNELPSKDSLIRAMTDLAEKLTVLRNAPTLDEAYSGPVLFTQQAAAEAFAQIFAPNFVAQKDQLTDQGFQTPDRFGAFQQKIGGRVLPEFLSVEALPNMKKYEGASLTGHYLVDDQGVKPQDVELVKDGYLKTLLSSRTPTRRVKESNGHTRGGSAMLSVLKLNSKPENALSYSALKEKLIKLVKDRELPFGLIAKKALNENIMYTSLYRISYGSYEMPQGDDKLALVELYKVYPDGREEMVRGTEAFGLSAQSFKDIINVGSSHFAYNYLAPAVVSPFVTGGDQFIGATVIVPDLLFEDADVKNSSDDFKKPPIMQNPLSSGK